MSRQRIRASVLESSTEPCPQCGGSGHVRSVSSVALQLLRSLEEVLMKGATHNLVVRTRTDVALYVLNHKRGHLRDLENAFKVSLAVIADPTVSGQQSFVIDRGEQVHTLEAAKALLAAQAAATPIAPEEAFEDEEAFDLETESEVETDETEGLSEGAAGDEAGADGAATGEGSRRRRRRRRRGRGVGGGEARESGMPREEAVAHEASSSAEEIIDVEEGEDEESGEPHDQARSEQGSGERRPRRRGRRGGRRRRGGGDEGLAGSIADELSPIQASEVTSAVADFDGYSSRRSAPLADETAGTESSVQQPAAESQPPQPSPAMSEAETAAQESEKARRRSTVREKVSFAPTSQAEPLAPSNHQASPDEAPAEPARETATEAPQPRRAGWWSRRFGGGG
jgi:ribonuclease E